MTSPPPEEGSAQAPSKSTGGGDDEVARLRAELLTLRARLDTRRRRDSITMTLRRAAAAFLIAVAAFAFVASVVGVWGAYTILNTNRWVTTVTPLPKDPQVAAAVAEYTSTEVFAVLDVEQRLRETLPEQATFIAAPLTGQVQDYVRKTVDTMVRSDRFQAIWIEINRRVHRQAIAILEGKSTIVSEQGDRISIDLLPIVNEVLRELSTLLPTLFGRQLTLPNLTSGEIPANLREVVETNLGIQLPANFAQFTIDDSGRLREAQEALLAFKRGVVALVASTVVLLGVALWVSPRRRRTVLQLGVWLVVAAVVVSAILRALRTSWEARVPAGVYRDGVSAAITIIVAVLRERGIQIIWLGAILAIGAYLVGPGRVPVLLRRSIAAGTRETGRALRHGARLAWARGPAWTARHRDVLRVTGVVAAAAIALLLSSWTSLLALAIGLVVFEVAVTLAARTATAAPGNAPPDQTTRSRRMMRRRAL